jgi:adenylylsulfate kinase
MSRLLGNIKHEGMILWLTGLPAAGKTTLATMLFERLKVVNGKVQIMDGDVIRSMNQRKIGYTREERIKHVIQVGRTARGWKEQGFICIVAVISPYREVRQEVIKEIGAIELFVDAPLSICKRRDPKGLYEKALRGEIKNFTGIDDPYDPPLAPDVHLHTDIETPEECVSRVIEYLLLERLITVESSYQDTALPF